jgi:vacuolar-type H+-ATPase subunit H
MVDKVKENLTHSKAKLIEDVEKTFAKTYEEKLKINEEKLKTYKKRISTSERKNIVVYLIILIVGTILGFILNGL